MNGCFCKYGQPVAAGVSPFMLTTGSYYRPTQLPSISFSNRLRCSDKLTRVTRPFFSVFSTDWTANAQVIVNYEAVDEKTHANADRSFHIWWLGAESKRADDVQSGNQKRLRLSMISTV